MKNQLLLVTGGAGRIGRQVVEKLRAAGARVRIADMKAPEVPDGSSMQCDLTRMEDARRATEDVDTVIHLAAIPVETGDAEAIFRINVGGTFNLLEAAAQNGVHGVVFASSVVAYGMVDPTRPFTPDYFPVDERAPLLPDQNYGLSKVMGESLCHAYSRRYGMHCVALRIASVLFPDSPFWQKAIENIANPEHELVPGLPMRKFLWQYVHVDDVAEALKLAAAYIAQKQGDSFEAFNIGASDVFSSLPALTLLERYFPDVPVLRAPAAFAANPQTALFDISKARRVLHYKPAHTWRSV